MKEKFAVLRINGIETDYVISNKGRVFTKNGEREKATELNKNGYVKIALQIDKKAKLISVHRAVYESFVGDIPMGMQINHKNGNKLDNSIENLEVVTPSENIQHAWRTGLSKKQFRVGTANPNCDHTEQEAIEVYTLLKTSNLKHKEIAELLNLDLKFVDNVSKGLWGEVTGFNKEEIRRNNKFTEKDDLIIWYLYSKKNYKASDLTEIMNFDQNSINNKLTYIKRNKKAEMDEKIKNPEIKRLVESFLERSRYHQFLINASKKKSNQYLYFKNGNELTEPNETHESEYREDNYQINDEEEDEGMLELDLSNYREDDYQINENDDGILELDLSTYREADDPEYITNEVGMLVIDYK